MTRNKSEFTVLNGRSHGDGASHQQIAQTLIDQLRDEMDENEFAEFTDDLREAVITAIINDLDSNLLFEDWLGAGFEEPEDYLNAEEISEFIGEMSEWYFKDDQIGKSWDILQVVLEHAEEHGLVERDGGG